MGIKRFVRIAIAVAVLCGPGGLGVFAQAPLALGADVSWLPQMEASGFAFYDRLGVRKDALTILKENGMNTVRLRTWVDPSTDRVNGHCGEAETVALAVRAQAMGFRLMIDFHYSDTWADPGNQSKPKAWAKLSFEALLDEVGAYTARVMKSLAKAGVYPEWVQVGNEINPGMLWPDGAFADNDRLARLIDRGYDAVKAVSPKSLVVVHLASGTDNAFFRRFFDTMRRYSAKYDVIGCSYYPFWEGGPFERSIDALISNLIDMNGRYGKPTMVVETGDLASEGTRTYAMLRALIDRVRALGGQKSLGVLYWEPQGAEAWSGYKLSCWQNDGKPNEALAAFLR